MPLITLDQAPLKKAFDPSSFMILLQQSIVPLYMMSAVETDTISDAAHAQLKSNTVCTRWVALTSFASRLHHHTTSDCVKWI